MNKHWVSLFFLAASSVAAQTKPQPKPGDFAMEVPVQISGQNGVVQLTLPLIVYQSARNENLADVRIFNAAGTAVPFTFVDSIAKATTVQRESSTKIFPVSSEPASDRGDLELDVRAARDGTVLSVHAKQNGKTAAAALHALVLDLGAAQESETLDSLQFFLPTGTNAYRAELAVEQSVDLKLWDRVAQSRVDWLNAQARPGETSSQLINDRVQLSPRSGRYVRIRWIEGTPLQFARIVARWHATRAAADPSLQVELLGAKGRFSGDWTYSASPALRAQEIGLDLPTANTVMPAAIGYYRQQPPPKREWIFIPVTHNTFYRLTQSGAERTSSRIHIYPLALEEWVVRPQTPLDQAPKLILRLKPRTVVFTAQGDAKEFLLAFGASADQLKQWSTSEAPLSQVAPAFGAAELERLEQATLGEARKTRPADEPSAPKATAGSSFNNRTAILWVVLIIGTLLLAAMTWRLFKQMQTPGK